MSRLYLRFYLALFASLVAFALIAVGVWHSADGPMEQASATLSRLAANILPPANAPVAEQQAALERLTTGLDGDVTLLDPQHQRIAFVGHPLQLQQEHINHLSWSNPYRRGVVWLVHLPDGRWLLTSVSLTRAAPMHKALMLLLGLAFAISIGAYPLVRWLTKRLERLQVGVESLGAGDLKARVTVEGRDEVARLATSFNRAKSWSAPTRACWQMPRTSCVRRSPASDWRSNSRVIRSTHAAPRASNKTSPNSTP